MDYENQLEQTPENSIDTEFAEGHLNRLSSEENALDWVRGIGNVAAGIGSVIGAVGGGRSRPRARPRRRPRPPARTASANLSPQLIQNLTQALQQLTAVLNRLQQRAQSGEAETIGQLQGDEYGDSNESYLADLEVDSGERDTGQWNETESYLADEGENIAPPFDENEPFPGEADEAEIETGKCHQCQTATVDHNRQDSEQDSEEIDSESLESWLPPWEATEIETGDPDDQPFPGEAIDRR